MTRPTPTRPLVESVEPFRLGDDLGALRESILVPASVLSLSGQWTDCQVTKTGRRSLTVLGVRIDAGMSGSPIVVDDAAVGVIGLGGQQSPQAELRLQLPVWIVQALGAAGG